VTDRFIDKDETQIYGEYAAKKIRSECVGIIKELDSAVKYAADSIDKATAAVKAAIDTGRSAGAGVRKGATGRKPALELARELLARFSNHLDSHKKGVIDRKTFFTLDGTVGGVGQGTADVLIALANLSTQLTEKVSPIPVTDKDAWAAEVKETISSLTPIAEHADSAKTDLRENTPALEAARHAWLQSYTAAKDQVRALFRFAGKLDLMSSVFNDLAQPTDAKVTKTPEEKPPVK